MSLYKKIKILLILTSLCFGVLFVILLLGAIFPGETQSGDVPWYVWTVIGEAIVSVLIMIAFCIVVRSDSNNSKKRNGISDLNNKFKNQN